MSDENKLVGQNGEVKFTITVKRKETGQTETYHMIGKVVEEKTDDENGKQDHGA